VATAGSPAGTYPIVAGGAADADYAVSYVDGVLTIVAKEEIDGITIRADGCVHLVITGLPNQEYWVEVSADLSAWATLGSVQSDANGYAEFIEQSPSQADLTARFFRFVSP
jgi:hypothetical protein